MSRVGFGILVVLSMSVASAAPVLADPISPTYSQTYEDCTTSQNKKTNTGGKDRWTITPGCDSYQNEFYERPTTQTYQVEQTSGGEIFAAVEYYENLDIEKAYAGVDDTYFYGAIDLVGLNHLTEGGSSFEGLKYEYQILLSTTSDGASGYWISMLDASSLGTTWQLIKNEGQVDTNGSVGGSGAADGLSITKTDDGAAALGNGYETDVISDGKLGSTAVLWTRISPTDSTVIEFAIDYKALGFTREQIEQIISGQLGYLDFRAIKGDPNDPQNYLWNDEYTKSEAGSPYRCHSNPPNEGTQLSCDPTKSIFNTQGLGGIYTLDTLHAVGSVSVPVSEPASLLMLGVGLLALGVARRRRRSQ